MAMPSRQPAEPIPARSESGTARAIFDIGFNERLPIGQALILGLQNVFGMTGMFVVCSAAPSISARNRSPMSTA